MTTYLDENCVGSDASEIVFPHLVLCLGVACQMDTGTLVGAHVSVAEYEEQVLDELAARVTAVDGSVARLYMIADFHRHFVERKLTFTAKARRLGHTGNIFGYDTRAVQRDDGAYVRIRSPGAGLACEVFALPDEDAREYGTVMASTLPDAGVTEYSGYTKLHGSPMVLKTSDKAVRPGTAVAADQFKIMRVA